MESSQFLVYSPGSLLENVETSALASRREIPSGIRVAITKLKFSTGGARLLFIAVEIAPDLDGDAHVDLFVVSGSRASQLQRP
jgi:hypothetical protein